MDGSRKKKNILSEVNQTQKDKYVITHKWLLDIKKTNLQCTIPENLYNKEDPKRDVHWSK